MFKELFELASILQLMYTVTTDYKLWQEANP